MVETKYRIPGLPAHLALLSDLHAQPYQDVINSLKKRKPQLIAITGDFCYGARPYDDISPLVSQPYILPFLEHCAEIAPAYVSLGNHEQWLDQSDLVTLRRTGVTVLDNEWVEQDGLIIGGLSSGHYVEYKTFRDGLKNCRERYPERRDHHSDHKPDLAWLAEFAAVPGYHLLLSHEPHLLPLIPPSVELTLNGHAHGGQWRIGKRGLFAPGQGWLPKYTKGVYEGRLVVSTGLTNTAWVPRIFNPTEIVYLEPAG